MNRSINAYSRRAKFAAFAALAAVWLMAQAAAAQAAPVLYFLRTGQAGAQTQIDVSHSTTWAFSTGAAGFSLGGGEFEMKTGRNTAASISLMVYGGSDASGPPLSAVSLTAAGFCGLHGGNCQSYATVPFHFATGAEYAFHPNSRYFIALTSTAPDTQSLAYFIKGAPNNAITDAGGAVPDGLVFDGSSGIGEPMGLLLLGVALAALGLARRVPSVADGSPALRIACLTDRASDGSPV